MRKLIITALVLSMLGLLLGGQAAFAGGACGCKDKCGCEKKQSCCEQKTCTKCNKCDKCETKCGCKEQKSCGCKDKCSDKCEKKCSKPCCAQKTCTSCNKGADKCGCKDKCKKDCGCQKCRPMRCDCRPHTSCKDYDACCPPQAGVQEICLDDCALQSVKHPYELCFNGSNHLCDTGCCGVVLPCKRECKVCHTACKKVECQDGCGCPTVSYEYETTCDVIARPRVVPWWFNDRGSGNIYLDESGQQSGVSPITPNEYATASAIAAGTAVAPAPLPAPETAPAAEEAPAEAPPATTEAAPAPG